MTDAVPLLRTELLAAVAGMASTEFIAMLVEDGPD
jgi:hypothetical protein